MSLDVPTIWTRQGVVQGRSFRVLVSSIASLFDIYRRSRRTIFLKGSSSFRSLGYPVECNGTRKHMEFTEMAGPRCRIYRHHLCWYEAAYYKISKSLGQWYAAAVEEAEENHRQEGSRNKYDLDNSADEAPRHSPISNFPPLSEMPMSEDTTDHRSPTSDVPPPSSKVPVSGEATDLQSLIHDIPPPSFAPSSEVLFRRILDLSIPRLPTLPLLDHLLRCLTRTLLPLLLLSPSINNNRLKPPYSIMRVEVNDDTTWSV